MEAETYEEVETSIVYVFKDDVVIDRPQLAIYRNRENGDWYSVYQDEMYKLQPHQGLMGCLAINID